MIPAALRSIMGIMPRTFLLPLFALLLTSCQVPILGNLEIDVIPLAGTQGTPSTTASINFTQVDTSFNNGTWTIRLSNPEMDALVLGLTGSENRLGIQSYNFDGNANTFEVTFTVHASLQATQLGVSSTNGFVNVLSVGFDSSGSLVSMQGEISCTLDQGGSAVGTFVF